MMEEKTGYKKLIVWQKADILAYEIYQVTKAFPRDELFGIVSQLRRASLSVSTNFSEIEYLIDFPHKLEYLSQKNVNGFRL